MSKVGPKSAQTYVAELKQLAVEVKAGKVKPEELELRARALQLNDAQYKEFWDPANRSLRLEEGEIWGQIAAVMPNAVVWTVSPEMRDTAMYYALRSIVNTPPSSEIATQAAQRLVEQFPQSAAANALRNQ